MLVPTRDQADKIVNELRNQRIEASPMWKPMSKQALNSDLRTFKKGVGKDIYERGLSLPSGSSLSESDISRVSEIVRSQLLVAS